MEHRRIAASAVCVPGQGFVVGLAEFGVAGYVPDPREPTFNSWDAAQARADEINKKLGVSELDCLEIVLNSIQLSLAKKARWKQRGT